MVDISSQHIDNGRTRELEQLPTRVGPIDDDRLTDITTLSQYRDCKTPAPPAKKSQMFTFLKTVEIIRTRVQIKFQISSLIKVSLS